MALDETLMADGKAPEPTLRLYRWEPWALSLGWFQEVDPAQLRPYGEAGLDVTRRLTGGGAILHADELTYSLVLPAGDPRIPAGTVESYLWIHGAVAEALRAVGVETAPRGPAPAEEGPDPFFCFQRTASIDLVAGGRKLVGSAQRRTAGAFLQHGSIPLTCTGSAPAATSLARVLGGRPPPVEALEEAMASAFRELLGATPLPAEPSPLETARALRAVTERFGHAPWVLRPRRRPGRATGPVPPPPPRPPAEPPPLRILAATVEDDALSVTASVGGDHPRLPHGALRAIRVVRNRRTEVHRLTLERDPWDSTFRRSAFAGTSDDPEGRAPMRREEESEQVEGHIHYDPPHPSLVMDIRRFNYGSLGPRRTGAWERDFEAWRADLMDAADRARSPGSPPPSVERLAGEGRGG